MPRSTLALLTDLAAAVAAHDPVALFDAADALADRIGRPAAVAVAQAMADELANPSPGTGLRPRLLLDPPPGPARCA